MSFATENTQSNQALSKALWQRVYSQEIYAKAFMVFWRLFGLGICAILLSIGFYFLVAAYYAKDRKSDWTTLSLAVADGLKDVTLRAEADGSVTIDPTPSLSLAENQTIRIDPRSTVPLSPDSEIRVNGEVQVSLPFAMPTMVSPPLNRATRVATAEPVFAVFKHMPYRDGYITTGWYFLTTNQDIPASQVCYYAAKTALADISMTFEFAVDGKISSEARSAGDFDPTDALKMCIWHPSKR